MKVDIIIPCYNAKDTIVKTLSSICLQKGIEQASIYLINDCSDYDYSFYVDFFSNFINIKEIKTEKNVGPGGARDLGIQQGNNPYIIFIDSDDYFYDSSSIYRLYDVITKLKTNVILSNFLYMRDNEIKVMENDLTWLHGKMYDRNFIEQNQIHFNNTRANEDNGFNRLVFLLSSNNYCYLTETTYVYNENPQSITRKNNREYKYTGLEGFTYNMNWAMTEALSRGVNKELVTLLAMNVIVTMYFYYLELFESFNVEKIYDWTTDIRKFLYNNEYYHKEKFKELIEEKRTQLDDPNIREIITFEEFIQKLDNIIEKEKLQ